MSAQDVIKQEATKQDASRHESGGQGAEGRGNGGQDVCRPAPTADAQNALRNRICAELRKEIGERSFATWFEHRARLALPPCDSEPHTAADDTQRGNVIVRTTTAFERDCAQRQFAEPLRAACLAAGIANPRVTFMVDAAHGREPSPAATRQRKPAAAGKPRPAADPSPRQAGATQDALLRGPDNNCSGNDGAGNDGADARASATPSAVAYGPATPSLRNLVVGEPNATAAAVVHQVATGERVASPLLLWGASGAGKTHLLRGLRQEVRRHNRRVRVIYLTAEQFCTAFVEAVQARGLPSFRNKHRGVELLLIDDLQFLRGKTKTVEELLYTIDTLTTAGATIVLSSDRPPSAMAPMSQELASRLAGGLSIEVGSPDLAMRTRLVTRLASARGQALDAGVVDAIAAGVAGGSRELSGVVNRLAVEAELLDRRATAESVRRVIEQTNAHTTPQLRLADIQTAVCQVFGLERNELRSTKRTKAVAEPRMLAMWLSRKYTPAAWSEIGAFYGRRSHSTVISACRRVETLLGRSPEVRGATGNRRLEDALRQVEAALRTA